MAESGSQFEPPTEAGPLLRADLHSHTWFSPDSRMRPEDAIRSCVRRGITCLAVTDHNRIEGALEVAREAPFKVIVGEEVRTDSGEIIGYFLEERVPPGLSARATVELVKAQGGLVCVPHPFDRLRASRLSQRALEEILPEVDVLEVLNARIHLAADRRRAELYAAAHGLPISAGSDAHTPEELGGAYVEMPDFDGPAGFLKSLRRGTLHGRTVTPLVHLSSLAIRLLKGRPT